MFDQEQIEAYVREYMEEQEVEVNDDTVTEIALVCIDRMSEELYETCSDYACNLTIAGGY